MAGVVDAPPPAQLRLLPSDPQFRLAPEAVAAAVAADRAAGRRPFCVVATSGTTSTGSVDPLADLAALCQLDRRFEPHLTPVEADVHLFRGRLEVRGAGL